MTGKRKRYSAEFKAKVALEALNLGVFYSLREAEVLIEAWRRHFNTVRPHSSLGYVPPAPAAVLPRSRKVGAVAGGASSGGRAPAKSGVALPPTLH